ncbi:methyltransferase [Nostoc sp. NOS(2021)]|uniref:methyltransferase n=1 Tax=Nostoc sp. NOS(2021) TaxID=2815407 RepID=UPI0025EE7E32|nr:methyltransferase [Nostoc sp. NOS(2021)]
MVLLNSKPSKIELSLTTGELVYAYWISRMIYVVAKLGIADLLKDGSQHCDALASATNTHSDSLYRVLRSLAGFGIFAETQPRCFELTPQAESLQSDVPGSVRKDAILRGEEFYYKPWENLMYSVQTGESAFEHLYGVDLFQYYEQNPVAGEMFHKYASNPSLELYAPYLEAYDFSSIGKLVDIGGGTGNLLTAILEANPTMTGVLFDLPKSIDRVKNLGERASVHNRCQLIGGSFFEGIPEGGDVYLLKEVIHLWDDEQAINILKHCHQAMKEQGRLLVIECIMPSGNEFSNVKLEDVHMLVVCSRGRERTETEFKELFKSAGFKLTKIIPIKNSRFSLFEGVKP